MQPLTDSCVLRRALKEATKAFLVVLDNYTVDDLIRPEKSLAKLIEIDCAPPPRDKLQ
jgi:DNA-binding IscR family transcriptional regulator